MRGLIEGLENPTPLLRSLPAIYHEDMFAERLTWAFDEMLAPVVSTLDNLDAYIDPGVSPHDVLAWLATWVGFPIGETWPEAFARELVARAVDLYCWRGTARGVRELVAAYTGVEPEIVETGGVSWSTTPGTSAPGRGPARRTRGRSKKKPDSETKDDVGPHLLVRVRARGSGGVDSRHLEALIAAAKPAHVPHTLEVIG